MPPANESMDFICSKHRTDMDKGQYEQGKILLRAFVLL